MCAAVLEEAQRERLERCFAYAVVWAFGGFLSADNKALFGEWWRTELETGILGRPVFPAEGPIWGYHVNTAATGFSSWMAPGPPSAPPPSPGAAAFVSTPQSMAYGHLISLLVATGTPVHLHGDAGSGKTALVEQVFGRSRPGCLSEVGLLPVVCSPATSAGRVWRQLRGHLRWRWGRNYAPRGCRRLVCFIDDMHNAQVGSCWSAML